MKLLVTFGFQHCHFINGKVFDRNCVCVIRCDSYADGCQKAEKAFGREFCMTYAESDWDKNLEFYEGDVRFPYYPRGFIELNGEHHATTVNDWVKYKKKPVVIEAMLLHEELPIETLEGTMVGNKGDYLIKGMQGELYPCKPDIFEATYEKLNNDN